MLNKAPPQFNELLDSVRAVLGFPKQRKAMVIGIDGRDGAGKSFLASWLAWQLEMPAIHLDMYIIQDSEPRQWRCDDLKRAIDARIELGRPVIVEGILLLEAIQRVGYSPGFLVFVENVAYDGSHSLGKEVAAYLARHHPQTKANCTLKWSADA